MAQFKPLEAADSADLHIDHPGGNTLLRQVEDFKFTDGLTREPVMTVGSQRPRGFQVKPGEQMIELTVRAVRREEVPWRKYLKSGVVLTFTAQYYANKVKGDRVQASCVVAECGPAPDGGAADGKHTYNVKLLVMGEVQGL